MEQCSELLGRSQRRWRRPLQRTGTRAVVPSGGGGGHYSGRGHGPSAPALASPATTCEYGAVVAAHSTPRRRSSPAARSPMEQCAVLFSDLRVDGGAGDHYSGRGTRASGQTMCVYITDASLRALAGRQLCICDRWCSACTCGGGLLRPVGTAIWPAHVAAPCSLRYVHLAVVASSTAPFTAIVSVSGWFPRSFGKRIGLATWLC
ncbi:hypothetical protein VPH35_092559 [Triticum aestivum]